MEEIESLCVLLTVVGQTFDARAHMDVYFSRMKELTRSVNVSSRMQYMLQVCIFIFCDPFLDLALFLRMSLSCVIANGFHVTKLQLHRRSPKYMKGYVYLLF